MIFKVNEMSYSSMGKESPTEYSKQRQKAKEMGSVPPMIRLAKKVIKQLVCSHKLYKMKGQLKILK